MPRAAAQQRAGAVLPRGTFLTSRNPPSLYPRADTLRSAPAGHPQRQRQNGGVQEGGLHRRRQGECASRPGHAGRHWPPHAQRCVCLCCRRAAHAPQLSAAAWRADREGALAVPWEGGHHGAPPHLPRRRGRHVRQGTAGHSERAAGGVPLQAVKRRQPAVTDTQNRCVATRVRYTSISSVSVKAHDQPLEAG